MSKKRKALQISALLTAVSGATMIVTAGSATVNAAESRVEERCWDQERTNPTTTQYRLHGCAYDQYGLRGDGNNDGTSPGAGGGGGGGGVDPTPDPTPPDPYTPG